ncbi:uroporphyrinogen-III synthase [Aliiroseovarius sp. F47248L]|uniref:uroporphyrinogen-III synthase n=1 Tax=Aliiroseovarius sp. F47248L TaxID=2926420 RepID=UPI001FF5A365|nr:uroporphyrinogen-III synthase [Aliiroseovarius sp. F47248L]MCK0140114.1 uroporphyrinogen-III synthase [Aliiroseovarius sp. F47248L]
MSTQKTLVLTRPEQSADQLLDQISESFGPEVPIVCSPIMKISPTGVWPDFVGTDLVIATSVHAIHGPLDGKPVFCVGARTADAAQQAGGDVRHCALDAASLLAWMETQPDPGNVLYLRGSHVATDIPAALAKLSIRARAAQTYRQDDLPLTDAARKVLEGERPAILPLYSPRSARLVGQTLSLVGERLHVITISDAVAEVWRTETGGSCVVVAEPTGEAMADRIIASLRH